jgi:hypothetical protein
MARKESASSKPSPPSIIIPHHGEKFPGFPAPDRYRHWIQVVAREMHLRDEKNRYG